MILLCVAFSASSHQFPVCFHSAHNNRIWVWIRGQYKLPKKCSASPHRRDVGLCGAFVGFWQSPPYMVIKPTLINWAVTLHSGFSCFMPLNYQRDALQAHTGELWGFVGRLVGAIVKQSDCWLLHQPENIVLSFCPAIVTAVLCKVVHQKQRNINKF